MDSTPYFSLSAAVAQLVPCTEAEGPGKRFALWFQGCPLRCPGCCNPEFLPFKGGTETAIEALIADVQYSQIEHGIEGITLLGGEPFAHAPVAAALAEACQQLGLSVMIFTGYTREELERREDAATQHLLHHCDILVDGPYRREEPDTTRRWIGSRNQRVHCLTERYRADDPCWQQPNTLEIRVRGQEITINGFPASSSQSLWRGWHRKPSSGPSS